ncbi:MAG: hypothetical protein QW436_12955, partial [Saccharolobus sp.]
FNYFFNHFSISSLYYDYVHIVLPQYHILMSSLLMTGFAHEVLGVISVDGRVMMFLSTSLNELRVTVYDPLRGVPVELEVIKSKRELRHG